MADHGARGHAQWSASATNRNWACPGALTLAARAETIERESEASAWGTAAHQVAEKCLRGGKDAAEFLDTVEKTKEREIPVDEEMVSCVQEYLDYISLCGEGEGGERYTLQIEQQFSLAALNPPFEAGGTADAVIYDHFDRSLEVVDLKGGRGVVVDVTGNPQLRTYALGAMLANPGLAVDTITVTIVQPRAPHKDGRIRSETFHVADLLEWTGELLAAMRLARSAMILSEPYYDMPIDAQWARDWLRPGDHCRFCPAAGFCPALEQRAIDAAGVWFDDSDQPRLANAPDSLDPAALAQKLDMFDMIAEWMNAVRAYAHAQAENGVEIPGYQLSEKIGNRAWRDESLAVATLANLGLDDEGIYARKLKSPAQIEKVLGAKRKHLIGDMVERPVRGTNLVASTKTTRPPVQSTAAQFFEAT